MAMSRSKILSLALIVSMAVNVIIGGFVTAQWLNHGFDKRHSKGGMFNRRAAMEVLPDAEREKVHKLWKARLDILRPKFREYGMVREQLATLLGAEILDQAAINAVYAEMSAKRLLIDEEFKSSLIEFAESLPPEQRAEFFKKGFHTDRKHRKSGKDNKD